MTCIIVDDEPLAREAIQLLVQKTPGLVLLQSFANAATALQYLKDTGADLVFLDIQMPGINGIEFSRMIPDKTLVIFTTAYAEYALDGFDVDAVDYLIKPVRPEKFEKAVTKAGLYLDLLKNGQQVSQMENAADDYFFVKADRKYIKIHYKEILFVEGLKDYVVMQTDDQKIITAMNIKTIHEQLPANMFVRISKSYIINVQHITSFDNNMVFIRKYEIPIGNAYRNFFFEEFVTRKTISR